MEKELKPGEDQPVLQPMAVAPLRHTSGAGNSPSVLPPRLLVVDIASASRSGSAAADGGGSAESDRQLLVSVQLSTDAQPRAAGASSHLLEASIPWSFSVILRSTSLCSK